MEAVHARYPFLESAREAVDAAGVDLASVIAEEPSPVLDRAIDRVHQAITTRTTGTPHRSTRVELLSYPVARVLVSLVNEPGLTTRYARAEAETAYRRFTTDLDTQSRLRSATHPTLSLDQLLREFNLTDHLTRTDDPDAYQIDVVAYLRLSAGLPDDHWRLINREVTDGTVTITRTELYGLVREAIRERVEDGLPFDVPPTIGDALEDHANQIRRALADIPFDWTIDTVDPARFPPCITALLEPQPPGEALPRHSVYTLASFLATIGMPDPQITNHLAPLVPEGTDLTYLLARLREDDDRATYPPPSCETLDAYGDCVNKDALCHQIDHPLEYYHRRIHGNDDILTNPSPDQA